MSLRQPLSESLDLLHQVCGLIRLDKSQSVPEALQAIQSAFPRVKDFERDFPFPLLRSPPGWARRGSWARSSPTSTRPMGIRHFFVLAPNKTIYNKLIADFSPGIPKYVFQGLAEFATTPPEIITGDNYESGRGIRDEAGAQKRLGQESEPSTSTSSTSIRSTRRGPGREVRASSASARTSARATTNTSQSLDDLVLLMDESHRYRASAGPPPSTASGPSSASN